MTYKRILLKLSGEALMGNQNYGIDPDRLSDYAGEIKQLTNQGVQVAVVIGGGGGLAWFVIVGVVVKISDLV